jgi:hypothetical protein
LRVDGAARQVIQALKLKPRIMRYELTDYEWAAIKPFTAEQDTRHSACE